MPLFLANLAMASYFLALCYVLITAMTVNKYLEVRRVLKRHQHTTWSTVQLLILSVALGSFFRSATFSTLCIFDSQATADLPTGITGSNPWIRGGLPPDFGGEDADGAARGKADGRAQAELDFYNKVVAVLFNLPDFLFVSSYLLLVLVWAEAFQSSRRHWFSAAVFRRKWMIFYLVFNGGLYLTQLVLYASLFLYDENGIFDDDKQDRLSVIPAMIFYLVAAADLFLPIIIFSTWLYLTLSLSGFPFKSPSAQLRLQHVGRLVMAWSFGRILYSVMTLLTFTKGWFNVHRENASTQAMLLVVVFFAAELIPIYLTLDKRLLAMLSVENYEPLLETSEFESEIRQYYEVENAQKCGKWKQFHFQAAEARRQLAVGIERDFRQFCHQSGIEMAQWGEERGHTKDNQESESLLSPTSSLTNDTTFMEISLSIEDSLRLHLAQEWVHQERFNIQEAFTNQTKKLQEDLDTFMGQQEAGFLEERQKVLNASSLQRSLPENDMTKSNCTKTSSKFQSSTKRGMLLQTAPPLRVEPNGDGESRQLQWRGATAGARAAETKRKAGMQWIGRQCAHLFAQLDCKETEARVIALLTAEELTQLGTLRHRACEIAASNKLCQQIRSKEDDCLPLIPGSNSSKRLQQQPKNA
ncbi:hypothetical protein PRNP1_008943 [Phytophthora ramorum]